MARRRSASSGNGSNPEEQATQWLERLLDELAKPGATKLLEPKDALRALKKLPPEAQVRLLAISVERLVGLWGQEQGRFLSTFAGSLYKRKLPYDEESVRRVLEASKQTCGFGEDSRPPLELAVRFAQEQGVSPQLAASVRSYIDALKELGGVHIQHIKTWAQIFMLVDSSPGAKRERCWSLSFQESLSELSAEERAAWTAFVLAIKPSLQVTPAPIWHQRSEKLIETLGADLVLSRLEQWIPAPSDKPASMAVNGSHLLKYFVWLLSVLVTDESLAPRCDALASRITEVQWKPKDRAAKVATACAMYFSERPFEVGEAPMARLVSIAQQLKDGDRIVEFYQLFMHRHRPN